MRKYLKIPMLLRTTVNVSALIIIHTWKVLMEIIHSIIHKMFIIMHIMTETVVFLPLMMKMTR